MQVRAVKVSKRSLFLLIVCLTIFILLSSVHICQVKDSQKSIFHYKFSSKRVLAAEENAKEGGGKAVTEKAESEGEAKEGEEGAEGEATKEGEEAGAEAEAEGEPVKYSIWQDFCALIFAAIIIAAAYNFIKRRAAQPPKEHPEHHSH